jgi:pyruvate dehydrogenase E1 component beta subunit
LGAVPIGKARVWREGTDVTIVSFGIGMQYARPRPPMRWRQGRDRAEVIDLRTLRPMDTDTVVQSVQKTNRCVTVEEGWPVCSIGNHISAVLMAEAFDWLDAPVLNAPARTCRCPMPPIWRDWRWGPWMT